MILLLNNHSGMSTFCCFYVLHAIQTYNSKLQANLHHNFSSDTFNLSESTFTRRSAVLWCILQYIYQAIPIIYKPFFVLISIKTDASVTEWMMFISCITWISSRRLHYWGLFSWVFLCCHSQQFKAQLDIVQTNEQTISKRLSAKDWM